MNKKFYEKPVMDTIELNNESSILGGSSEEVTNTAGNPDYVDWGD